MSTTTKWVIAVLVVVLVLFGLWKGGYIGTKSDQGAAVLNSAVTTPVDSSDAIIAQESAGIEAQMKVAGNQFAAFSQVPTAAKADLLVGQFGNVSSLLSKLATRLQARVTILKTMGYDTNAMQGAISDMSLQLSYAVSQIGATGQIVATIKPDNGDKTQATKNSAALQQAKIELQKTQNYLVSAQKDIKTVVDGFKAIATTQATR